MTLQVQFLTLGMMLLSGAVMGAVFDTYRVLAGQLRISRWVLPFLDILYWIAVTVFVFQMLGASNEGQLRFFVFIGLVAGAVLYYLLFSGLLIRVVYLVIRAVRWTAALLAKIFVLVVVRPLQGLFRLVVLFLTFLWAVAVFLFRIVLQLLYPFRMLGRWLWRITLGRIPWIPLAKTFKSKVIAWIRKRFRKFID